MRAARQNNQRAGGPAHLDRSPRFSSREALPDLCFANEGVLSPQPEPAEGRRVDGARDWRPLLYQRNVNREFSVAGDKFLRSVQWVDQQEPVSDRGQLPGRRRLLSDDWNSRDTPSELGANDRFRALVGESDWAAVALGPNVSAMFINVHYRRSRGDGSVGKEDRNLVCASWTEFELMLVRIQLAQRRILFLIRRSRID